MRNQKMKKIPKVKNKQMRKNRKKNKNLKGNFLQCNKLKKLKLHLYKINQEYLKKELLIQ